MAKPEPQEQPLGQFGPVDITSMRPRQESLRRGQLRAVQRYNRALGNAWDLAQELQAGSPVVRILFDRYRTRLMEIAKDDPELKSIEGMIRAIREELELIPRLAEAEALKLLGPQLANFISASPGAPTGIPPE